MPQPLPAPAEESPHPSPAPRPERSLTTRLALRLVLVPTCGGAILFLSAGTWRFWQGWVFIAVYLIPATLGHILIAQRNPEAIENRLRGKEQQADQKLFSRLLSLFVIATLILPALDYRMRWSRSLLGEVPLWLNLLADALVLSGILLVNWVIAVNRHASNLVRVEPGQMVISAGPYRLVRHPMYSANILLWLATPLALGSWVAWPFSLPLIPIYVLRLLNEEKFLRAQLPGYSEYCQKTRFRLVPFVW